MKKLESTRNDGSNVILVTGAAGLVGARLVPRLVGAGFQCRALMRGGKAAPAGAAPVAGDLLDPASLAAALQDVTAIVHLAAVFRTQDLEQIWKSNLEGTRHLIAAAKSQAPGARFIMASTSLVYDKESPWPGRESDSADPTLDYPASKIAAEKELRESGLNWSILRFSFVYGDGDGHLESLPGLAAHAELHPAQRMSMVHHRDIGTATTLALAGAMDGHVVNIADDAPTSLYELAGLVGAKMQSSSEPLKNPWYLQVDSTLARRLGFQPVVRTVYQAVQEGWM